MTVIGTYSPDQLIAGAFPIIRKAATIESGNPGLKRSRAMARRISNGKWAPLDSAGADGLNIPAGILASDVDADASDATGTIYRTGEFNRDEVTFTGADTAADFEELFEDKQIWLVKPMPSEAT